MFFTIQKNICTGYSADFILVLLWLKLNYRCNIWLRLPDLEFNCGAPNIYASHPKLCLIKFQVKFNFSHFDTSTESQNRTMENGILDYAIDRDADANLTNESSNLVHLGELWPISDGSINSSHTGNGTCIGEPEYCNYTEQEYNEMIYDYIFPTPGEWVLIGFHTVVFLVGLVSNTFRMQQT